ncbi:MULTISPECIES: hypothetical protein [Rhodomicrobium]|uniref:hypothetical protein n=1 Tax=Rhodomicrobium TaxID=1068 RepID=UPI000B4A9239|nr:MULTISPECIES: hypothetical protein [Rhodomicrobium]
MTDVLSVLWTIVSFIVGILWGLIWFILSDLLSTLLWICIAVWLAFVLRYRSFGHGSLAVLRWGRYGLAFLWRWIRGRPGDAPIVMPQPQTRIVREYQRRIPLGYASVSEQINMLIVLLIIVMAHV